LSADPGEAIEYGRQERSLLTLVIISLAFSVEDEEEKSIVDCKTRTLYRLRLTHFLRVVVAVNSPPKGGLF